ncbi:MAG: chromosomal replication initiator protein DnaA, partial [Acidimicrobiales bacterium]
MSTIPMPQELDAQHLWSNCANQLRSQVSDVVWATTFNDVDVIDLSDNTLRLAVPSTVVKERLEGKFHGFVKSALVENGGDDIKLQFEVHTRPQTDETPDESASIQPGSKYDPDEIAEIDLTDTTPVVHLTRDRATETATTPELSGLSQRQHPFTFDDFVIGQGNRFAHAAALAVAERPALAYNPLFIYGAAGLGKTHLLRSIANFVADHYPHYSVRYVSSEEFLNDFVEAIRLNTLPEFKRRYREVDLLLVDDIQFIEGKEGFQEEFFHTFNTLHQGQRQIVVSSDRPPDSIPTLEDRLRSRFKMGLITDIQPPDLETRLAILRQKGHGGEHRSPSDDVLLFIATNIKNNIRELEGALIRVTAYSNLTGEELTVEMAEQVLSDIL